MSRTFLAALGLTSLAACAVVPLEVQHLHEQWEEAVGDCETTCLLAEIGLPAPPVARPGPEPSANLLPEPPPPPPLDWRTLDITTETFAQGTGLWSLGEVEGSLLIDDVVLDLILQAPNFEFWLHGHRWEALTEAHLVLDGVELCVGPDSAALIRGPLSCRRGRDRQIPFIEANLEIVGAGPTCEIPAEGRVLVTHRPPHRRCPVDHGDWCPK